MGGNAIECSTIDGAVAGVERSHEYAIDTTTSLATRIVTVAMPRVCLDMLPRIVAQSDGAQYSFPDSGGVGTTTLAMQRSVGPKSTACQRMTNVTV